MWLLFKADRSYRRWFTEGGTKGVNTNNCLLVVYHLPYEKYYSYPNMVGSPKKLMLFRS